MAATMTAHYHECPICGADRDASNCPDVGEPDSACWDACSQHRSQWDDQIHDRPGAFS